MQADGQITRKAGTIGRQADRQAGRQADGKTDRQMCQKQFTLINYKVVAVNIRILSGEGRAFFRCIT